MDTYYLDIFKDKNSHNINIKLKHLSNKNNWELVQNLNYNWINYYRINKNLNITKQKNTLELLKENNIFWENDFFWENWFFCNGDENNLFLSTYLNKGKEIKETCFLKIRRCVKNNTIFNKSLKKWNYWINTLQCLFWWWWIKVKLKDWKILNFTSSKTQYNNNDKIDSFIVEDKFTLYEYESLVRNISLIKHIVNQGNVKDLILSMPQITYYFYWIKLFERWILNINLLFEYFKIIKKRVKKVEQVFIKRFPHLNIKIRRPLSEIEPYLIQHLSHWKKIDLDEILWILNEDPTWNTVLKIKKITKLDQLYEWLCETVEEIKTSIDRDWCLWIIVKNPKEENTLAQGKDIVRKFSRESWKDFSLIWIYQMELINTLWAENLKSLYHLQWNNGLHERKIILNKLLSNKTKITWKNEH